jgi:glycerol kinase
MLNDSRRRRWSEIICNDVNIPMAMVPEVRDCAADFGAANAGLLGGKCANPWCNRGSERRNNLAGML